MSVLFQCAELNVNTRADDILLLLYTFEYELTFWMAVGRGGDADVTAPPMAAGPFSAAAVVAAAVAGEEEKDAPSLPGDVAARLCPSFGGGMTRAANGRTSPGVPP